jgi:hypothetical protein
MSKKLLRIKRKNTIRANKSRIYFEKTLRMIGYRNRDYIKKHIETNYFEILKNLFEGNLKITAFYTIYPNKKTYLYHFYTKNKDNLNKRRLIKYMKMICNDINLSESGRIGEIGWRIDNPIDLLSLDIKNRVKTYLKVLAFGKTILKSGNEYYKPIENDILVSNPDGIVFNKTPFPRMMLNKRGKINEKIGFGSIKPTGSQYAKYDKNLNLNPI